MAAYSGSYRPQSDVKMAAEKKDAKNVVDSVHNHSYEVEKMPLSMQSILKKIEAVGLETDDLLLALVLFLMYRESGDKDLLILLGAMLLS